MGQFIDKRAPRLWRRFTESKRLRLPPAPPGPAVRAGRVDRFGLWLAGAGMLGAVGMLLLLSPFPPGDALRHYLSMSNCATVEMWGLAPARRGQPGYWPWHDADNDGIACEWS